MLGIVTLVRNRNPMLDRLLAGLAGGDRIPEVTVVRAGGHEDPAEVAARHPALDVRVIELAGDDERIPYSVARNTGAAATHAEHLCFLDADCVPSARFVRVLDTALGIHDALCTVDVRYLPPGPVRDWSDAGLRAASRRHPHRPEPPTVGVALDDRHELVWGLCMAMRHASFDDLGGFDAGYAGYAGEDTDLAVGFRASGRPVGLVGGAVVFHQHHDSFEPPLQQFEATVANARRFHQRWGRWPMEGWLGAFRDLGLLRWDETADHAEIVRLPTADEIAAARRDRALPFRAGA